MNSSAGIPDCLGLGGGWIVLDSGATRLWRDGNDGKGLVLETVAEKEKKGMVGHVT